MQYTVWIIPPEPLFGQLSAIVERLAREYGGPTLVPHLSILTDIERDLSEVKEKFMKLAKTLVVFKLSLGSISFSTTYFQSVFVRVNSTAELMQINLDAKKLFDRDNDAFMPHVSLMYGSSMEDREKAALSVELPNSSFVVKEFVVTPAEDPYHGKRLAIIPFGVD